MEPLQKLTRRQLETLRLIAAEERGDRGVALRAIASGLSVRSPTALAHLGPLEQLGLVVRHRGKSRTTARGKECLTEYLRHHRVAESMFSRAGLSPSATHVAALEVDLVLSHQTVEEICEAAGHPKVCPHGEPIAPCSHPRGGPR